MAKAKSSASSATRKKHEKKAAKAIANGEELPPLPPVPNQRGQKKQKKDRFAPKVKSFTPPPPPPKGQPDPVDLYLAGGKSVDPLLVVVLRRLGKRDESTLAKGLEGFEEWVGQLLKEELSTRRKEAKGVQDEEGWKLEQRKEELVESMQVWAHHLPRLLLHPSRRLRLSAHTLHAQFTTPTPASSTRYSPLLAATRAALLLPQWVESAEYVASWAMGPFDGDRQVRTVAKRSWEAAVKAGEVAAEQQQQQEAGQQGEQQGHEGINLLEHAEPIFKFAASLILAPPPTPSGPSEAAVADAAASAEADQAALKTQALLLLSSLLAVLPSPLPLSDEALDLLSSEELWDHADPEWQPSKGLRRALYELLGAAVGRKGEKLLEREETVAIVAQRVLRLCWGEDEGWAGVIAFLRRYPEAWTLADEALVAPAPLRSTEQDQDGSDGSDDGSDSEDEEDDTEQPTAASTEPTTAAQPSTTSPILTLLFLHLQTACTSNPSAYPTILLLLSTIPSNILSPTSETLHLLFENFWSALESRALSAGAVVSPSSKASPTEEWAAALLECLVLESGAMLKAGVEEAEVQQLVREWVGRMWLAFLGFDPTAPATGVEGKRRPRAIATPALATSLANTLAKLGARDDGGAALFEAAWEPVAASSAALVAAASVGEGTVELGGLAMGVNALAGSGSEVLREKGSELAVQCVRSAVEGVSQAEGGERSARLLQFAMDVREVVQEDAFVLEAFDSLATSQLATLLADSTTTTLALTFLTSYLPSTSPVSRSAIWSSLYAPSPPSAAVLLRLVEAVSEGQLDVEGFPEAGLESWVLEVAGRVFGEGDEFEESEVEVLKRVMVQPQPFVPAALPSALLAMLAARLPPLAHSAIAASSPVSRETILDALVAPTLVLAHYLQAGSAAAEVLALAQERGASLPLALYEVGYVLPNCRVEDLGVELPHEAVFAAQEGWAKCVEQGGEEVVMSAIARLQEGVVGVEGRASPIELVALAAELVSPYPSIPLAAILPSSQKFDSLLSHLTLLPPSASLSILSPLVPLSTEDHPATYATTTDDAALSPYARALLALLEVAARAENAWIRSRANLWILPHVLLLADVARDELASAGSTRGFFARGVGEGLLARLVGAADGLASYLVSSVANDLSEGWHMEAVKVLRTKERVEPGPAGGDELVQVLDGLARRARKEEEVYARRGFGAVLGQLLRYSEGTQDADRWLAWGQSLNDAPDLTCAIILAVKPLLLESPRFERYQNELAASLAGVPSAAASAKGLPLLRLLLATTPPLDAPIIFLPQQRTMFLIQAVQKWIGSDDDLDEEILASVAELFLHLAPIVQELSGSHWELVFDVVESNLETASWDEPVTLPALYHSCRLLLLVKELAAANAELKATARARIDKSLELVRDLFVSRPDSRTRNKPRVVILEIMAKLIRDLPPKLLTIGDSFDQLLHLLRDPSLKVQQSSYDLVVRIAEKHVSDLVVEVELETETPPPIALPQELVELLTTKLSPTVLQNSEEYSGASTYLLAWLVAFRFFETASPRIKSAYIDQLRRASLIADSFLPSIFAILNLSDRTRVIDVTPWAVNEFHLELVNDLTAVTLPVFATFVYYRALQAVPSLIREWWERCKNRQLTMAVSNFTSRHFSPVLIAAELAHLRDPDDPSGKQLRDNEDFNVKVAQGANEVKATFVVDEETMEIGIKLPAEFPLVQVEVKDVRKIGVTDSQWRAWLLAVQQVITNQNGLIAEALNVFKRNVTLHFEGVEACAICYSSISVVDRSLPTKSCRICSQRFHAGCLYKWFNTSSSATCPLCRGSGF